MLFFCVACPKSAPPMRNTSSADETATKLSFFLLISPQPFLRIDGMIILPDLEIQIARSGIFALANACNRLSSAGPIAHRDERRRDVAVERENAISVVENDQVTVPFEPLREENCSLKHGADFRARR